MTGIHHRWWHYGFQMASWVASACGPLGAHVALFDVQVITLANWGWRPGLVTTYLPTYLPAASTLNQRVVIPASGCDTGTPICLMRLRNFVAARVRSSSRINQPRRLSSTGGRIECKRFWIIKRQNTSGGMAELAPKDLNGAGTDNTGKNKGY
ncbi:hypothetical protein B0H19DRAFT_1244441 [Mycena capillaripes]|nr:hypothetical protein B0H19DRAFT_1244441 [Mycena capillaripes]